MVKRLLLLAFSLLVSSGVHAQSSDVRVTDLIDHKDLRVMAGSSNQHFHRAVAAYQRGDRALAAKSIRAGRVFVAIAVGHAKNDLDRSDLMTSFYELGIVAEDIDAGKLKKVKALREVFSRANYALSRHYQSFATGSIREADRKLFKQAMATHGRQSASWVGEGYEFDGMTLDEMDAALDAVSKTFGETRKADEVQKRKKEANK